MGGKRAGAGFPSAKHSSAPDFGQVSVGNDL